MNQKISFVAFAILLNFAFSNEVSAQAAAEPSSKSQASEFVKKEVKRRQMRIEAAQNQLSIVTKEIDKEVDSLRKKSISDIAYEDVFRMLQLQKVELTIELEGLGARMSLLNEKAASTGEENDVVDSQREILQRYVANQKKVHQTLQKLAAKGAANVVDVAQAETLLAEAELRLKEFDVKSKQTSPKYVEALFETTLAVAERKAKLQAVEKLLSSHVESRKQVSELHELMEERSTMSQHLRDLLTDLLEYETVAAAEF